MTGQAKVTVTLAVDYFVPDDPREVDAMNEVITGAWFQQQSLIKQFATAVSTAGAILACSGKLPARRDLRPLVVNVIAESGPVSEAECREAAGLAEETVNITEFGTEVIPLAAGHA